MSTADELSKYKQLLDDGAISQEEYQSQKNILLEKQNSQVSNPDHWYQKNVVIILFLIFFFPVGLFLMWRYAQWSKKSKWIISTLFAFLILLSAFSDSSDNNPSSSPVNQVSPVPTQAPPTSEENEAADDSVDVVENESSEGELSTQETEYIVNAMVINNVLSQSMQTISQLADDPMKLYTDDDYQIEIIVALAAIKQQYKEAKLLSVPPLFTETHEYFLEGLRSYSLAADSFTEGIDNLDADAIEQATLYMEEGTENINQAEESLRVIQEVQNF